MRTFKKPRKTKVRLSLTVLVALILQSHQVLIANFSLSDEEAFRLVRDVTKSGRLPNESFLLQIEDSTTSNRTRDLVRLIRARIRFEAGDFKNSAVLLEGGSREDSTKIGDYTLWLKGRSLAAAKEHRRAIQVFDQLIESYPESLLYRDVLLLKAESLAELKLDSEAKRLLQSPAEENDLRALAILARIARKSGDRRNEISFLRRIFFYGGTTPESKSAEVRLLELGESLDPATQDEMLAKGDIALVQGNFVIASNIYADFVIRFPNDVPGSMTNKRISALLGSGKLLEASDLIRRLQRGARGKEDFLHRLAVGFAKAGQWESVRGAVNELQTEFPKGALIPKALVESGMAARNARNRAEEEFFLGKALREFPDAVEVASAQFELAWLEHQAGNHSKAADMLIEHLARYSDRDSTHRGRAGYWAARNSERAGRTTTACKLYESLVFRYNANWYGHIGGQRLEALKQSEKCREDNQVDPNVIRAAENLKKVTVSPERSGPIEVLRAEKAEELAAIGLFDWSLREINEAQRSAPNSPRVNLALARHHKMKGDNVTALLSLSKSYPDYAQMFPEELSPAEWEIFYPLTNWKDIKYWAQQRSLDPYKVAGLIRQESVFQPRARSSANAYGLMQLLLPTARQTARKYNPTFANLTIEQLYNPATNIELGTAYMKDQLEKYGRIEYMSAAYNAGPGRMTQWRQSLPAEIDEFVEAVPFRETRGYIQGIIRNTEQYRRLYDENGNFRSNVGTRPASALNWF